jgi:hypothetical protein
MKNLISLVGRFSLFAVLALIVVGFSGSNAFGQYHPECSVVNQGDGYVQLIFQPKTENCQKAADAFQAAAAFVPGAQLTNPQL